MCDFFSADNERIERKEIKVCRRGRKEVNKVTMLNLGTESQKGR